MNAFLAISLFLLITHKTCQGWVSFYQTYLLYAFQINDEYYHMVSQCRAAGAAFGRTLDDGSLSGCLFLASPLDACSPIERAPIVNLSSKCMAPFAQVLRGNCSFALKVLNVQNANYQAAVIYNDVIDHSVDVMYDDDEHHGSKVYIPSFLVNSYCGIELITKYSFDKGYLVTIRSYWTKYDVLRYFVPFLIVVGLCFFSMFISMVLKCIKNRQRSIRRRLSTRILKSLPIRKYKKNETPDSCAICLDDFQEGEKLRVLPCHHWYHTKCVDPWLTKNRKVCPICKRKVDPNDRDSSDSEANEDTNDRRPLLTRNNIPTNYNTATSNVATSNAPSTAHDVDQPSTSIQASISRPTQQNELISLNDESPGDCLVHQPINRNVNECNNKV